MAEYIDKNKILDRLDRLMHIATEPPMDADDKAQWVLLRELHKEFSETPTADVEEVKRGEWIDNNTKCSVCGGKNPTTYIDDDDWVHKALYLNYCPNCGARMDGGKEE